MTTNGPYSAKPYFLHLTKDGNPNAGTTYDIGDSGPADVDQRRVVDPSFLPAGQPGFAPGTPTFSATPLAWTHAQYLRLARNLAEGRIVERPAVVADRYLGGSGAK